GGSRGGGPVPGIFNPRPAGRGSGFAGGYPSPGRYGRAGRRAAMPTRTGPPTVSGRWSLLPERYGLPETGGLLAADGLPGSVASGAVGGAGGETDPGAV